MIQSIPGRTRWVAQKVWFIAVLFLITCMQTGAAADTQPKQAEAIDSASDLQNRVHLLEDRVNKLEGQLAQMTAPAPTQQQVSTASQAMTGKYSPEMVRSASVDYFFKRLGREPEPGYHAFAAMWALIDKGKTGSAADRDEILRLAIRHLDAGSTTDAVRWHAAYVLSGCKDRRAIPVLSKVLANDRSPIERGVAACALGEFDDARARDSLTMAAATEKDPAVQKWIQKALAGEFQKPDSDNR